LRNSPEDAEKDVEVAVSEAPRDVAVGRGETAPQSSSSASMRVEGQEEDMVTKDEKRTKRLIPAWPSPVDALAPSSWGSSLFLASGLPL